MAFGSIVCDVECGGLMPVFAVAKGVNEVTRFQHALWKTVPLVLHRCPVGRVADHTTMQFLGDGHVVGRRVFEGLESQGLTKGHAHGDGVINRLKRFDDVAVTCWICGDEDVPVVLGRGSNHGWAPDVNHFQQRIIAQGRHRCSGITKRVEVASHHANGGVAKSGQFRRIGRLVKSSEKGTVNGRVE